MDSENRVTRAGNIVAGRLYANPKQDSELIDTYQEIRSNFVNQKLILPGIIFQIYDEKRNTEFARFEGKTRSHFKGAFLTSDFYSELVFSKRMLTDHMPNYYEIAVLSFSERPDSVVLSLYEEQDLQ